MCNFCSAEHGSTSNSEPDAASCLYGSRLAVLGEVRGSRCSGDGARVDSDRTSTPQETQEIEDENAERGDPSHAGSLTADVKSVL